MPTPLTRLLRLHDAHRLAELLEANREFLAPFDPARDEDWFTVRGQETAVRESLARHSEGLVVPHVVLAADGQVVGRISLNNVVRGAFQSCSLGYWVDEGHTRRGLATAAVGRMLDVAFREEGLHRVEAGTLVDNLGSQKVLLRNGFERFGLAPKYLRIAGRWQDHVLFQRLDPLAG